MNEELICSIATPLGKGVIGIIRFSGSGVLEIVSNFLYLKAQDIRKSQSHRVYLGYVFEQDKTNIVDEVMFVYMKSPKTYTGEDTIEISAHNNLYILNKILELGIKFGARLAKPGEFTERAFLNGKMDLTQAEAVLDVIHAESSISEKIAQKQLNGGLSNEVMLFRNSLLDVLKDIEVLLDHADMMDIDLNKISDRLEDIKKDINLKVNLGERVKKFYDGINIALVGRPNVGKSSLLNAILRQEKAIVSDMPGTTRDPIEVCIEHKDIKMKLIDTAGLKAEEELLKDVSSHGRHVEIERKGIKKTNEYIEYADYVFFIIDLAQGIDAYDLGILETLKKQNKQIIIVGNKLDLESEKTEKSLQKLKIKKVSALNGVGVDELLDMCVEEFLKGDGVEGVCKYMVNARHKDIFCAAIESVEDALGIIKKGEDLEIIAADIRRAIDFLGEILGLGIEEEILDRIFKDFCIGK